MSNDSLKNSPVSPRQVFTDPVMFLAFGFGSGLAPKAPGTFGTLAAVPVVIMLSQLPFWAEVLAIIVISIAGIAICGKAAERLGVHDHSGIVWDEIAGYAITVMFVPDSWQWWLLGFLLFRLFDIVKPWPIRELDHRMSGGLGIMLDDVVAGLFSAIVMALISLGVTLI